MDTNNEILDAIEILTNKKIGENITKILTGICKSVNINNNTCVMDSNGVISTVQFYGSPPEVNELYRIFVPSNNMSRSFIVVPPKFTVNPNLLDNWYFGNPVNQRGQTSYTANGYAVDRWRIGDGSNGTLSLADSGLKLARTDGIMYLTHRILKTQIPEGNVLTYSVLTTSGLFSTSFVVKNDTYHEQVVGGGISLGWNYTPAEMVEFTLVNNTVNSDITIIAAKLELGSTQTLAHQENDVWVLNEIPDYGEQLRKCQRYFVRYAFDTQRFIGVLNIDNANSGQGYINLPVSMRATPTISGPIGFYSADNNVSVNINVLGSKGGLIWVNASTATPLANAPKMGLLYAQTTLDISADL